MKGKGVIFTLRESRNSVLFPTSANQQPSPPRHGTPVPVATGFLLALAHALSDVVFFVVFVPAL
ncbi:hypothetical protein OA144_00475, partial [bacterium]|nr:hypothetical protein [bacterium]